MIYLVEIGLFFEKRVSATLRLLTENQLVEKKSADSVRRRSRYPNLTNLTYVLATCGAQYLSFSIRCRRFDGVSQMTVGEMTRRRCINSVRNEVKRDRWSKSQKYLKRTKVTRLHFASTLHRRR